MDLAQIGMLAAIYPATSGSGGALATGGTNSAAGGAGAGGKGSTGGAAGKGGAAGAGSGGSGGGGVGAAAGSAGAAGSLMCLPVVALEGASCAPAEAGCSALDACGGTCSCVTSGVGSVWACADPPVGQPCAANGSECRYTVPSHAVCACGIPDNGTAPVWVCETQPVAACPPMRPLCDSVCGPTVAQCLCTQQGGTNAFPCKCAGGATWTGCP